MLLDGVLNLLRRHGAAAAPRPPPVPRQPAPSLVPETELAVDDDPVWPSARVGVVEALWGEGFLFPGGREETLRLAKPLGLSAASSLLLLGAGSGGPARCIATELGGWVSGYEANAHLAEMANERTQRAGLGRRAEVQTWDPSEPVFPQHYYHHAIAIEPLHGAPSEPTLGAVSLALKQGGQFVLIETVADRPLDPNDAMVATWTRLDHRSADVPSELAITKILGHLGFDVRIVEGVSPRDIQYAIRGWTEAVRAMHGTRPTLQQTALIVREAELWMARVRLMRAGKLRLVRWHAMGRG
jgi:cyclopropane fatty-acyl-phospholipid synthase-like methyltransferase